MIRRSYAGGGAGVRQTPTVTLLVSSQAEARELVPRACPSASARPRPRLSRHSSELCLFAHCLSLSLESWRLGHSRPHRTPSLDRRATYKKENARRRHDYVPFLLCALKHLARKGTLMPAYEAGKTEAVAEFERKKAEKEGGKSVAAGGAGAAGSSE